MWEIQNNYSRIISQEYLDDYTNMTEEEKIFLTKMFVAFSCAPIDELIEIDHEDNEWITKSVGKTLKEQRMDTFSKKGV